MANKITKRDRFETLLTIPEVTAISGMEEFIKHELELLAKKNSSDKKPTKVQEENERIKQAILDGMKPAALYTVTDIQKSVEICVDLSNQKISQLMRQLVADGLVDRTEEKRKAYFSKVILDNQGEEDSED